MAIAWFVDGSFVSKLWGKAFSSFDEHARRVVWSKQLDWLKLRLHIERLFDDRVEEAYYFDADPDPPTAARNAFHNWLAFAPPTGPGLRVKIYWLQQRQMVWPNSWGGGPVTHPLNGKQLILTQQKAVDVGLAFHLMRSHAKRKWDKLALCAGDGDFHEVVQHLVENEDVNVALVGGESSISMELRPYARKGIVDIVMLSEDLKKGRAEVPEMRARPLEEVEIGE